MAETRINKDVPIFGENALAGEIKEFGNLIDSTDINALLSTTEAERGWFFLGVNDFPTKEIKNPEIGMNIKTKSVSFTLINSIAVMVNKIIRGSLTMSSKIDRNEC